MSTAWSRAAAEWAERGRRIAKDGEHPVDRADRQVRESAQQRRRLASERFRAKDDPVYVAVHDEVPILRNGELHIARGKAGDGTWRTRCGLTWEEADMRYREPAATCRACLSATREKAS